MKTNLCSQLFFSSKHVSAHINYVWRLLCLPLTLKKKPQILFIAYETAQFGPCMFLQAHFWVTFLHALVLWTFSFSFSLSRGILHRTVQEFFFFYYLKPLVFSRWKQCNKYLRIIRNILKIDISEFHSRTTEPEFLWVGLGLYLMKCPREIL